MDRWLWAVRITRTCTAAAEACRGGHVMVNRARAKPATPVRAGDVVEALLAGRARVLEVVRPIERRVGAPEAAACVIDRSPPPPPRDPAVMPRGGRERGAGRPTGRERRQLDRLRGRGRR